MEYLIGPFLVSAGISVAVSWLVIRWGRAMGIIDDPKKHIHPKVVHETPVHRGGGLPILAAWLISAALFLPWEKKIVGIGLGVILLGIIGFVDDKFEEKVSPHFRLVINVLAALMVIGGGVGIAFITSPGGGIWDLSSPRWCWGGHCLWLLSDLFVLVWLVWTQNIVGWSSGVDGQLPGFVIVAAGVMAAMGLRFGTDINQQLIIVMAAIVAGAYAGFLLWNWYPQKIMPGYGGKSLAGFLLGVLAIFSGAKVGAMIMVLCIPSIDGAAVIVKRLAEHRSPVWGGREHLHHYLLDKGWGKRRIAVFYWLMSLVFGVGALQLNSQSKYFTMATAGLLIGGVILWFHYFSTSSKRQGPDNG